MPLCLHGTIGAAKILFDLDQSRAKTLQTRSGLQLQVVLSDDIVQVRTEPAPLPKIQWDSNEVESMLGIKKSKIAKNLPYTAASVGSPKLLVPLISPVLLGKLRPDFEKVIRWSEIHKINGFYVYAPIKTQLPHSFSARGFNPRTGHHEDAATGVAAAALATCLKHNLAIDQGHTMNKPSRIFVSYKNQDEIWVGGKVIQDKDSNVPMFSSEGRNASQR